MLIDSMYEFVNYGLKNNLIEEIDAIYIFNKLQNLYNTNYNPHFSFLNEPQELDKTLNDLTFYALDKKLIKDEGCSITNFKTRLLDYLTPIPSIVQDKFFSQYKTSPIAATNYFYDLMMKVNYVKREAIKKNIVYENDSLYGKMIITINLSKPEKDPKEIKKALTLALASYPKCQLCYENVGYGGNKIKDAKNNLRVIPIKLNNLDYYFQYSPYGYYNEHCIVFKKEHEKMKINKETFENLFAFVDMFPHYFLGSNADLPIVGGSILSHDHYQGGNYVFPLDHAKVLKELIIDDVKVNILFWPLTCFELLSSNKDKVINLANKIYKNWQEYNNEKINIFSSKNDVCNTVTPIARKKGNNYSLILALRNNKVSTTKPYGYFHPDEKLHHIKKENIGLIEVMGLAILPGRLKDELDLLDKILKGIVSEEKIELIAKHKEWYNELKLKKNVCLKDELGKKFIQVLESTNVFKYGSLNDVIDFLNNIK